MEIKLKIAYNKEAQEICIIGDKNGLEFLADCCRRIIGKTDHGHFHLMPEMNNVTNGSIPTILVYSDDPEEYK